MLGRVQNTALQDVILTAFDQTQLDYFDPVKPTQRVHLSRSVNICCLIWYNIETTQISALWNFFFLLNTSENVLDLSYYIKGI